MPSFSADVLWVQQEKLKFQMVSGSSRVGLGLPHTTLLCGKEAGQDTLQWTDLETSFLWFKLSFRPGPCSFFVQYKHSSATGSYSHFVSSKPVPRVIISVPTNNILANLEAMQMS